jgi:hypothetical protein
MGGDEPKSGSGWPAKNSKANGKGVEPLHPTGQFNIMGKYSTLCDLGVLSRLDGSFQA